MNRLVKVKAPEHFEVDADDAEDPDGHVQILNRAFFSNAKEGGIIFAATSTLHVSHPTITITAPYMCYPTSPPTDVKTQSFAPQPNIEVTAASQLSLRPVPNPSTTTNHVETKTSRAASPTPTHHVSWAPMRP